VSRQFQVSDLWQGVSTELLDTILRFKPLRSWALNQGQRQLFQKFVVENRDGLPPKVQEMRCRALFNLLHSVNRALSDGRIGARVRRSIIKEFIGNLVIGEKERMRPFREQQGIDPPTFLTISPTKRCNLRCKGCYAASSVDNRNTLPYAVFDRILKEKRDAWGSHFTVISGGEPLMYRSQGKDLFDVLAENRDQYFMMYTNSTLIDDRTAHRMAQAGNITPAISVEGWEQETDERRGKGVFAKIQRAMDTLKEAGVPFGISVTATRHNAETILSDEFLDYYFQEKGAIYGWIFQYMPIGRSYTVDLMVTPEQRQWMLEKELEMIREKNLFLVDFWNGGIMSLGCISAGRSGGYFYIDWDGNVSPCVFFPYKIANVHQLYDSGSSLSSVLTNDYFKAIRSWQKEYLNGGDKVKNLFMPCPIRDHYQFAYQTITACGAQPADEEATRALADPEYRRRMIEYNGQVRERLDPLWSREVYPDRQRP
jgi:MoaA/NifB/PqqE/SkfB family radical SAM enzyme